MYIHHHALNFSRLLTIYVDSTERVVILYHLGHNVNKNIYIFNIDINFFLNTLFHSQLCTNVSLRLRIAKIPGHNKAESKVLIEGLQRKSSKPTFTTLCSSVHMQKNVYLQLKSNQKSILYFT